MPRFAEATISGGASSPPADGLPLPVDGERYVACASTVIERGAYVRDLHTGKLLCTGSPRVMLAMAAHLNACRAILGDPPEPMP